MDEDRFWTELRDARAELCELRNMIQLFAERLRTVEIARENMAIRNNSLPGWVIAGMGVAVSLGGVLITLYLSGRVP